MTIDLVEGDLTFSFPVQTSASKYDGWSHYRNQFQSFCGGSKAVDFVCRDGDVTWLIEVKDFRQHRRVKTVDLPDEIALKVRDTIAGLVSAKFYANELSEKTCADRLLRSKKIRVVCHIEQPAKHSKLFPRAIEPMDLKLKLKTLIKAIDAHLAVVDSRSIHADMPWSVEIT